MRIIVLLLLLPNLLFAQVPDNWQHLDPEKDSVLGVSTFRAYDYLKGRKSNTVIVAIIDNGVDIGHADLQGQFWTNPDEIPDNGVDDDKNGYIDDMIGWNFLGNQKGQNIKRETTELTRIYSKLKEKYAGREGMFFGQKDSLEFAYYQNIKKQFESELKKKHEEIDFYQLLLLNYKRADQLLKEGLNKQNYTLAELREYSPAEKMQKSARNFMLEMQVNQLDVVKIQGIISNLDQDLETRLNPAFSVRQEIIGDDPGDLNDSIYGNNMVWAQSPYHGTGVAGTIGALWNNFGVKGVSLNVKLMILRVLPNGDERDKDVALAIRYAVREGASIINASFGKLYTSHPEFVQQAIREAENEGVLIVHAAGNDGKNNDSIPTYPTGYYADGKRAGNWLSVGATSAKDDENLVAFFSNYGKNSVDIFAPGVDIESCVPGNKYEPASGTSVAAPVVAGIAAVLKSYFPKLQANELKEIILQSAYHPVAEKVLLPGDEKKLVPFRSLSKSGGIANLYRAILLAEEKHAN